MASKMRAMAQCLFGGDKMRLLMFNHIVWEIIPEFDPAFPGVPVTERYSPEILQDTIVVPDDTIVSVGQIYNPEDGTFSDAPTPTPIEHPEQSLADQVADQQELNIDHEYRITLLELGVDENDAV